jgi:cell division protein ZapA (FtsZ GTPase activity inhibitor)
VGVKRTITLEIGGAKFRIVSDADQAHLTELASIVNERVERLGHAGARSASSAQLLALVALGLADEMQAARNKLAEVDRITRSAISQAIARIDQRLAVEAAPDADES